MGYIDGYEDGSARIYCALHHLIIDAVSWRILIEDIKEAYEGQAIDHKTSSYRQWTETVKDYAKGHQEEEAYWTEVIGDLKEEYPGLSTEVNASEIKLDTKLTKDLLHKANSAYHTEINDLLLTALGYALKSWSGLEANHITLEGHGREHLKESIDVSRTVGWFTTIYPVRLEVKESLSASIKGIKESLRKIPNKGIGYGALRYTENSLLKDYQLPRVSFNYLGQFDNEEAGWWQIAGESSGINIATENKNETVISINGAVMEGELGFTIVSQLEAASHKNFIKSFEVELKKVLNECIERVEKKEFVYTPSDFPIVKISQGLLDRIQDAYEIEAIYPANSLQQGFVYHVLSRPEDDAYRVQMLFNYQGELDVGLYRRAWNYAVEVYPILRTSFNWEEEIIQIIHRKGEVVWEEHDISEEEDQERAIKRIQEADRGRGFDLSKPELLRIHVIKYSESYYTILKSDHHSIVDGWSGPVVLGKVQAFYSLLLANKKILVQEDKSYLAAQVYYAKHKELVEKHWQDKLKEIEGVNDLNVLLTKKVDLESIRSIEEAKEERLVLGRKAYKALESMTQAEGLTLNVVVQYAWHKLIQSYTRDSQTIVGTTVSGREIPIEGIGESAGLYINTLPLIVNWEVEEEKTVRDKLKAIHHAIVELNSHSYVGLASLQKESKRLFHSLFVFENYPVPEEGADEESGRLKAEFREAVEKLDYPLGVIAYVYQEELHLGLKYAGEYIEESHAKRLLKQLELILKSIPEKLEESPLAMRLVDENEYRLIIEDWNKTDIAYPREKTINDLFEEQVARTPDAIAIVFEDKRLSYQELNTRSNQLARFIRKEYERVAGKQFKADTLIGICVERSVEMLIGILGILKAGGAYVPIDPDYPEERVQFILEDTGSRLILKQSHLLAGLDEVNSKVTRLLLDQEPYSQEEQTNLSTRIQSKDLAYVIYTSGTTGKPKGVMVEHQNVVSLITGDHNLDIKSSDSFIQLASSVFDAATFEIWGALCNGGRLIVPANDLDILGNVKQFKTYLVNNKVTILWLTKTLFESLYQAEKGLFVNLRYLLVGGEALNPVSIKELCLQELQPEYIINGYGPTEGTTFSTFYRCKDDGYASVPIGKALNNRKTYVLDVNLNPVPVGVIGELYIGGAGLARGYLNREELTAERFIRNPFASEEDTAKGYTRLYKTGDLVRWLADGNLEYIGRNDFQVKLRGFRIELGEIESKLLGYPGVKQSVVLLKEKEGSKYLVGYYVAESKLEEEGLRAYLEASLPDYMVPSVLVHLETFPLTINGKLSK